MTSRGWQLLFWLSVGITLIAIPSLAAHYSGLLPFFWAPTLATLTLAALSRRHRTEMVVDPDDFDREWQEFLKKEGNNDRL